TLLQRRRPVGSIHSELHRARPDRPPVPWRGTRRQCDHRLPEPSRLPVLVCERRPIARCSFPHRRAGNPTDMTHDVEKRFDRPGTFHEAAKYVGAVVAVAGVMFAIYATTWRKSVVVASMVAAILFAGGNGAFVTTSRVWKAGG